MRPASDPSALQAFLGHPSRPAGTLTYHELQGFLFTVVSAPDLIQPSEWIPIIFGEEDAGYSTLDEANEILGQIMALYNTTNASVLDPPTLLPADCPLREDVLANFEDEAPIAHWSRGFLRGHQWLEALWEETVPEELDDELGSILMTLSFFSSREIAEAFHAEDSTGEQSFEAMAEAIHSVVPRAVAQYVTWAGRSLKCWRSTTQYPNPRTAPRSAAMPRVRVAAGRSTRSAVGRLCIERPEPSVGGRSPQWDPGRARVLGSPTPVADRFSTAVRSHRDAHRSAQTANES